MNKSESILVSLTFLVIVFMLLIQVVAYHHLQGRVAILEQQLQSEASSQPPKSLSQ